MPMTAAQLKSLRNSLGLKQLAFADLLNIGQRQLNYLESGEKPIDDCTARACAWLALHGLDYPWKTYGLTASENGNRKRIV